jgi:uncharacterized Tic20 family protein
MSQNPEETPDRSADQGRSGSTPPPDESPASSPYDSGQSQVSDTGATASGSSTGPYDSPEGGSTTSQYGAARGPYEPPDASGMPSGTESYGQSQYDQGQSGPSASAQDPFAQPGFDQGAGQPGGQGGYPQYGAQADPSYGQAQYPPTESQPYGQPGPGGYDPAAQYGGQGSPPQQYGQPGYPQYPGQAGQAPVSESDEKLWALLAHVSIPFIWFIGPLIVYLIYKDRSPWLKEASTEALNFSILYSIASFVCWMLTAVLIGAILLPLVFIGALIFCILAALAANRHELYRYPINWRIMK